MGRLFSNNEAAQLLEEYLGTDPDDADALNRFKNGLNGMFAGAAFEGAFIVLKGTGKFIANLVKAHRKSKAFKAHAKKIAKLEDAATADQKAVDLAEELDEELIDLSDVAKLEEKVKPGGKAKKSKIVGAEKDVENLDEVLTDAEVTALHKKTLRKLKGDKDPIVGQKVKALSKEDRAANKIVAEEQVAGDIQGSRFGWKMWKGKRVQKTAEEMANPKLDEAKPMIKIDEQAIKVAAKRIAAGKTFTLDDISSINWSKVNTPEDLKQVMAITHKAIKKLSKDTPISDDTLDILVREKGVSIDSINNMSDATKDLALTIQGTRNVQIDLADAIVNLNQRMGDFASNADIIEMHRLIELSASIGKEAADTITNTARGLAILRKQSSSGMSSLARADLLVAALGGKKLNSKFAQRIIRLASDQDLDSLQLLKELERFAKKSKGRKMVDAMFEMYVNGLLSKPSTQLIKYLW